MLFKLWKTVLVMMVIGLTNQFIEGVSEQQESRIKGGQNAEKGAYPWQISFRQYWPPSGTRRHFCGGSIISSKWVATAAHCSISSTVPMENYTIHAGVHDFSHNDGYEQVFEVVKFIPHEEYKSSLGNHDIALVKISGEFQFDEYVSPIQLPLLSQDILIEGNSGMYCVTSGWGRLDFGGTLPDILQALQMPLLPLQTCKYAFVDAQLYEITEDMLCTGHIEGDKSPCHMDSGGPLACLVSGKWTLAGITSWGWLCGVPGYPALYTRVAYYHEWIVEQIETNEDPGTEKLM